jgi:5-formyltetrahydrofolate cyclo-ligase
MLKADLSDLALQKTAMRKDAAARRKAAHEGSPSAGMALADVFGVSALTDMMPSPGVVAGFWPIRSEIDPRPLMTRLQRQGHTLALPVIPQSSGSLQFRAWVADGPMEDHGFGTMVPPDTAETVSPDICLVPLLAFDRKGGRLGYGKGHYDRTLTDLRMSKGILAIGIAFSAQEVDNVVMEVHDVPLDWMVTEREAIQCHL